MCEVIGFEHVSYTAKNTGELVSAYRLYVTSDLPSGTGKRCEEVFLRAGALGGYSPALGDVIFIQRDARGYVQGIYKP